MMSGRVFHAFLAAAAALILLAANSAAGVLTVYTAVEADDLQKYAARFNEDHPDIEIEWFRESTGVITARLLAERDDPRADFVWGLAATSLLQLAREDRLHAYAPAGLGRLDPRFVDDRRPPAWTGMDAWIATICLNTAKQRELGFSTPASWMHLTKPEYEGLIRMPDPASSGTGFMNVSSWLQIFGEDDGWAFMDALHRNIDEYTHSGSQPCRDAASGEIPIGISFTLRAAKLKGGGAPIALVVPAEGVGWDLEAAAIVKGTDNLADAMVLADWSVSETANRMYGEGYAVVAIPELVRPVEHFPEAILDSMIANDLGWAAKNRRRILLEWRNRYGPKPASD